MFFAQRKMCCDPIQTFGTEEQKQKYLVPLAKGEKLGAFGLTEPGAGTDAQGQQTKAVADGDDYIINGSKIFITNGKEADVYVIFAVTGTIEKRGRKIKEITSFIVEKGTPGFTFGTKEKKMGIRGSSTYELIFTDCRVPKENMLGKLGHLFQKRGADDHPLDFAGALVDLSDLGIAHHALHIVLSGVAVAAVELYSLCGDFHGYLCGVELGLCGLEAVLLLGGLGHGCLVHQKLSGLYLGGHVSQLELGVLQGQRMVISAALLK